MNLRRGLSFTFKVDSFKTWAPLLQYKLMVLSVGPPTFKYMLMILRRGPPTFRYMLTFLSLSSLSISRILGSEKLF